MTRLLHFGCSFAVGNAVPSHIPGLESGAYIHKQQVRRKLEKKYNIKIGMPTNYGKIIADRLSLTYEPRVLNGGSNEKIMRELVHSELKDCFVLIGITSGNRREALTTSRNLLRDRNSHWQTWKMIGPQDAKKYKDLCFDPWGQDFTVALEHDAQLRTIIQILYMQGLLKANKVRYLMFNALDNGFDTPLNKEAKELLEKVDTKFFLDLTAGPSYTQHGWCLRNKELVVSEIDEHPNVQGQQAWAEKLMPLVSELLKEDEPWT